MRHSLLALLLAVPVLGSSSAWALFDAQVLTGKRSSDFKHNGVSATESGTELKAAFHLDPIPLVPIGFGLSLSQTAWDKSAKLGVKAVDGLEIGLELEAWLPIELAGFEPYAKLGYTVAGAYLITNESAFGDYKQTYKPSGAYVAAGLKYKILMRLGVMVEIEQSTRTLAYDTVKDLPAGLNGVVVKSDVEATNTSILLGIQAGI